MNLKRFKDLAGRTIFVNPDLVSAIYEASTVGHTAICCLDSEAFFVMGDVEDIAEQLTTPAPRG